MLVVTFRAAAVRYQVWPPPRGLALLLCTRDAYGKVGPFSAEQLKMDLPFVNLSCVQTRTQRSAGPFPPLPAVGLL